MRNALATAHATPNEARAVVMKDGQGLDVRIRAVRTRMACSTRLTLRMPVTAEAHAACLQGPVHAASRIMEMRVKSPNALKIAEDWEAAMLRQVSVHALKDGSGLHASSSTVRETAMHLGMAIATVSLAIVSARWGSLVHPVRSLLGARPLPIPFPSRIGTLCGISLDGSRARQDSCCTVSGARIASRWRVWKLASVRHHVKVLERMANRWRFGGAITLWIGILHSIRKDGLNVTQAMLWLVYIGHATRCTVCRWPSAARTWMLVGLNAKR